MPGTKSWPSTATIASFKKVIRNQRDWTQQQTYCDIMMSEDFILASIHYYGKEQSPRAPIGVRLPAAKRDGTGGALSLSPARDLHHAERRLSRCTYVSVIARISTVTDRVFGWIILI